MKNPKQNRGEHNARILNLFKSNSLPPPGASPHSFSTPRQIPKLSKMKPWRVITVVNNTPKKAGKFIDANDVPTRTTEELLSDIQLIIQTTVVKYGADCRLALWDFEADKILFTQGYRTPQQFVDYLRGVFRGD